ncbi:Fanconi anemia group D2 protein isoform X1 [Agrilus planipennis]|uniref:Fanconi anemia group D2 protein isoform X1 n=1 Tax=Agrilus planipennis TaxID=224129 RepID=A0A7F5RDK7_AGRPL|nr:Fanconi anemia group D2 protein isoform X1 [Agrilus planipennis]
MVQNTYFMEIITESKITINFDKGPNIITQEQALVHRDIKRHLQNHISYPDNAEEVVTGLKTLCEDENCFKKALMPTVLSKSINSSTQENIENKIYQDSIFRILLTVECLQSDIIDLLIENIKIETSKESEDTSWLRILLHPLKYLPFIKNEEDLADKMTQALEGSNYTSQLEIINVLPDIIPDSQHGKIAITLCNLMDSNPSLTAAIVDCLNSLELNDTTKSRIQDNVLTIITTNPSADTFPVLFEFLISDNTSQGITNCISKLRPSLDTIMSSADDNKINIQSNKALIVNNLKSLMLTSRPLREGVTHVINGIKRHADHKPVDLLLLILLYNTGKNGKTTAEIVLKKKIKSGLFRTLLLDKLFSNYFVPETIKEFLGTILDIASSLLQHQREDSLHSFAETLHNLLFNHKYIDRVQRQDIINSLVILAGINGQKYASSVLNILLSFSQNKPLLEEHTLQLMSLLELLDSFELKDVSKVFDLLCGLTCGEKVTNSATGFKDELHMLVRKQLSSNKKKIKYQGIVSAIMMIKHIAETAEGDQSDRSITEYHNSSDVSTLPSGISREAAQLLKLTNTNTLNNPEYLGLFYDQLAFLLMTTLNLDKHFLGWLFESMTNDFRKIYLTDTTPDSLNDITFSLQYSLNNPDDVDTPFGVNIAELTMKQSHTTSIMTLSPLFRLVRLLHEHDLTAIDALLGCGVVMPLVQKIDDFDTHQIKHVIDCLFHCINWFRELVSAFVREKSRQIRYMVLERISHIIHLEETLREYLNLVPDHILPRSYFDSSKGNEKFNQKNEKMKPPPKKKSKTSPTTQTLNDTTVSVATQGSKPGNRSNKSSPTKMRRCKINFRELDTDTILPLRYSLKFEEFNMSTTVSLTQQPTLNIKQFNFLVRDVVEKSTALTKQNLSDLSHFKVVSVEDYITDCVYILPNIMKNFQAINTALAQSIEQCHDVIDSPDMFSSTMKDLRSSFGNVIELISTLLNWPGFQNPKNSNLLDNFLKALRKDSSASTTDERAIELSRTFAKYFKQCLCLSSGTHLVDILKALYIINPDNDIKKKIALVSEKLLMKKWYNSNGIKETGAVANAHINTLITSYLDGISVEMLCVFANSMEEEVTGLISKNDHLPKLQSIDKGNFHVLFRGVCHALLEGVKSEVVSLTNNEHLALWKNTALTMQGLITIAKHQENKTNLHIFLKKSIAILKVFLSHGIPILEIMLRSKTDDVLEIFKIIQRSTRFLHHLCCTSKVAKDLSLISYVPQFRLTLESLLVRVKAALVANNCSSAFWLGTLKNRDLQGEDILTQSSIGSEESSSRLQNEPDDALPPEDTDEEIEEGERSEGEENGSLSDAY